jgi:hypothetical protein
MVEIEDTDRSPGDNFGLHSEINNNEVTRFIGLAGEPDVVMETSAFLHKELHLLVCMNPDEITKIKLIIFI